MDEQVETLHWYVLRVFTGKEVKVKAFMEEQAERDGFSGQIEEILIPSETIIEMRDGKRRDKIRVLYPGYMLIKMSLDLGVRHFVINTPNVIGFADNTEDPEPLRLDELDKILGHTGSKEGEVTVDIPFQVDDMVKISDGPFKDFIGSVKDINYERRKLKILVSIFGRSTPVEVDFLQVTTNISE